VKKVLEFTVVGLAIGAAMGGGFAVIWQNVPVGIGIAVAITILGLILVS
jgi:uncharacterized membrane protein YgaE (UPF0421/DUF939 family)